MSKSYMNRSMVSLKVQPLSWFGAWMPSSATILKRINGGN